MSNCIFIHLALCSFLWTLGLSCRCDPVSVCFIKQRAHQHSPAAQTRPSSLPAAVNFLIPLHPQGRDPTLLLLCPANSLPFSLIPTFNFPFPASRPLTCPLSLCLCFISACPPPPHSLRPHTLFPVVFRGSLASFSSRVAWLCPSQPGKKKQKTEDSGSFFN